MKIAFLNNLKVKDDTEFKTYYISPFIGYISVNKHKQIWLGWLSYSLILDFSKE